MESKDFSKRMKDEKKRAQIREELMKKHFNPPKAVRPKDELHIKEHVWHEKPPAKFDMDVYEIIDELYMLLLSKHKDYGPLNIAKSPGGPINGLRVRIWDKIARINHLVDNKAKAEHESLEDSFKDLANYAIIGMMVLREKWPTE